MWQSRSKIISFVVLLLSICYVTNLKSQILQPQDTLKLDTSKIVESVHPQDVKKAKVQIDFSGFVKVNTFYDRFGLDGTEGFIPFNIPVDSFRNVNSTGLYIGARQSRFGLKANKLTKLGPVKAYIEMDFAGNEGQYNLRLRHAYGQIGFFTVGHTWTTFTDLEAIPYTVDYEGPNSFVGVRQGLIRFEQDLSHSLEYGFSFENPSSDFFNPYDSTGLRKRQSDFDIVGRIKWKKSNGHFQIAAIQRNITYLNINTQRNSLFGWGVLVSGIFKIKKKGKVYLQYVVGKGVARYIGGLEGNQLDAFPDGEGELELLLAYGGYLAYEQIWGDKFFSTLIFGQTRLGETKLTPDNFYKYSFYGSINTFFNLLENLQFGGEFTIGNRVNKDGKRGIAERFQAMAKFTF
jgi:DcaP outer membrane protein